jgi:hypothetical protein
MANGDITHADVEGFIKLGYKFPASSNTAMTEAEADSICDEINSEVNLALKRLGFSLPLGDADNINWTRATKLFGASSIILDGILGSDTEEGNTRATRYWDRFLARLSQLIDTGGAILEDSDRQTDPRPNNQPILYGKSDSEGEKRFLRFPQRAAADHYDNEESILDVGASWRTRIRGF